MSKERKALERLLEHIDTCPRYETGVGGMSIEAQIKRTTIRINAWEVELARESLYD